MYIRIDFTTLFMKLFNNYRKSNSFSPERKNEQYDDSFYKIVRTNSKINRITSNIQFIITILLHVT